MRQQPNTEATPLPHQGNHSDCPNGDLATRNRQDFSVTCRPLTLVTDRLLRWAHCQNRSESRRKGSTFTLLSDHLGTHHLLPSTQQGLHSEREKLTESRFCLVPRAKTNRTFTSTIIPQNPGLSIANRLYLLQPFQSRLPTAPVILSEAPVLSKAEGKNLYHTSRAALVESRFFVAVLLLRNWSVSFHLNGAYSAVEIPRMTLHGLCNSLGLISRCILPGRCGAPC